MKTLVVVCHPHLQESGINKRLTQELEKSPDLYTIHDLYHHYPSGEIDINNEQEFIEKFDTIVLQYPLYWFNCPPLLKKWLDEVFLYGWAYGSKSTGLRDKNIGLVISAGIKEQDFTKDGEMKVTMQELISPFRSTFLYTKSNFKGFHIIYDTHNLIKENKLEEMIPEYIDFIEGLSTH